MGEEKAVLGEEAKEQNGFQMPDCSIGWCFGLGVVVVVQNEVTLFQEVSF